MSTGACYCVCFCVFPSEDVEDVTFDSEYIVFEKLLPDDDTALC